MTSTVEGSRKSVGIVGAQDSKKSEGTRQLITYVTRWAKTWHIPRFMKIEIRPEICISMCNYAAVKKRKRSVAWFQSEKHRERGMQLLRNTMFLRCYVSPYTIMLRKLTRVLVKSQLESSESSFQCNCWKWLLVASLHVSSVVLLTFHTSITKQSTEWKIEIWWLYSIFRNSFTKQSTEWKIEIWWLYSIFHILATSLTLWWNLPNQLGEHMFSQCQWGHTSLQKLLNVEHLSEKKNYTEWPQNPLTVNILHTKHWTYSWTTCKILPFWFHSFSHAHMRKDTRLSPPSNVCVPEQGSLGMRLAWISSDRVGNCVSPLPHAL